MLRITLEEKPGTTRIKIEGRLCGPYVQELDRTWRRLDSAPRTKHVCVDLCGMTGVDEAGKRLLAEIYRKNHAEFITHSVLTDFYAEQARRAGRETDTEGEHKMRIAEAADMNATQAVKNHSGGFLSRLSPAALEEFQRLAIPASYPAGAMMFLEGQAPRGVFLVLEGEVKLSLGSSGGKTLILRLARPGEMLGLMSTLSGNPYELTGEAMYPCQVAYLRREDFLRFIARHPEANQVVMRALSSHYKAACEQLRTLGLAGSAHEKLAKLLLDRCTNENETRDGARVRLPLTHEEIAELIGTSRETVTRTLSEFRSRRLVTRRGATFIIPNRQALASYAAA